MDARTLNLDDAFRLASLLSRHVDVKKLDPQANAVDFISDIVEKLSPEEYIQCVVLLTEENEDSIKKHASIEILTVFIEGLKLNSVVSLLHFCKMLGL